MEIAQSMAYQIGHFLLAYDEWTSGKVYVKNKDTDEYLQIASIRIDDEDNDIIIDVSHC